MPCAAHPSPKPRFARVALRLTGAASRPPDYANGDLGGSYLPSAYWRQRLHQILDTTHLTNAQLRAVDSLLLELDEFDRSTKVPAAKETCVAMAS